MPHTRIYSKWITDLFITKTIKILGENIGNKTSDIACSNLLFPDISPQARETEGKNKQMGLHQTKKFLHSKGNHQQNKKTIHGMGEHIHQHIFSFHT